MRKVVFLKDEELNKLESKLTLVATEDFDPSIRDKALNIYSYLEKSRNNNIATIFTNGYSFEVEEFKFIENL